MSENSPYVNACIGVDSSTRSQIDDVDSSGSETTDILLQASGLLRIAVFAHDAQSVDSRWHAEDEKLIAETYTIQTFGGSPLFKICCCMGI